MNLVQKPNNRGSDKWKTWDIVMATWNGRTMLQMQETAQEMIRHKTDIMALQEIRWQGTGRIVKPEFTEIHSGSQEKMGQRGTGFIISRKMKESMLEYETINGRKGGIGISQ
jgi:exonuclease III